MVGQGIENIRDWIFLRVMRLIRFWLHAKRSKNDVTFFDFNNFYPNKNFFLEINYYYPNKDFFQTYSDKHVRQFVNVPWPKIFFNGSDFILNTLIIEV